MGTYGYTWVHSLQLFITLRLNSGHADRGQGTLLIRVVSDQEAGNPAQVRYTIAACDGD